MAETTQVDAGLLITERRGAVGLIRLNRPKVLNALSDALIAELVGTLEAWDKDGDLRVAVLTGGEKVFAAGADISELAGATALSLSKADRLAQWAKVRRFSKPIVAAVSGFALGGGCELALSCDLIVASETAVFGQPELAIGVMPGAGGTQRLTRALGRYRAMEVCVAGRRISAREALEWGLASKVVPPELIIEEALALAAHIAASAPLAVRAIKQAVHLAEDLDIEAGLTHERHAFYQLFDSEDQKEGMKAFLEKRKPAFKGK